MRAAALPLLGALGVLAACAHESRPVSQSAPTVSYRIAGNDVSQANANAARYCQQYGASPQLQGIQQGPSGNVAVYSCAGAAGSTAGTPVAPAYAAPGYAQPGYTQPGYAHRDIVSGAGHDAAYVNRVAPTAMIFVPCADGISHNEVESATPEDLAAGCNVLLRAMLDRAAAR